MKFQAGDVVKLKSGGPLMTVQYPDGSEVGVVWFGVHDSKPLATTFPAETLEKIDME